MAALLNRRRLHNRDGLFLGSSIAIVKSGYSALISFLIAGLGTYFVFEQLAKLSAKQPEKGSFAHMRERLSALGPVSATDGCTGRPRC